MIETKYTKYPYEGKNKAYIPKLIHHVSLLISKMTLVNSWQAHPRNGYEKLDAKRKRQFTKTLKQGFTKILKKRHKMEATVKQTNRAKATTKASLNQARGDSTKINKTQNQTEASLTNKPIKRLTK